MKENTMPWAADSEAARADIVSRAAAIYGRQPAADLDSLIKSGLLPAGSSDEYAEVLADVVATVRLIQEDRSGALMFDGTDNIACSYVWTAAGRFGAVAVSNILQGLQGIGLLDLSAVDELQGEQDAETAAACSRYLTARKAAIASDLAAERAEAAAAAEVPAEKAAVMKAAQAAADDFYNKLWESFNNAAEAVEFYRFLQYDYTIDWTSPVEGDSDNFYRAAIWKEANRRAAIWDKLAIEERAAARLPEERITFDPAAAVEKWLQERREAERLAECAEYWTGVIADVRRAQAEQAAEEHAAMIERLFSSMFGEGWIGARAFLSLDADGQRKYIADMTADITADMKQYSLNIMQQQAARAEKERADRAAANDKRKAHNLQWTPDYRADFMSKAGAEQVAEVVEAFRLPPYLEGKVPEAARKQLRHLDSKGNRAQLLLLDSLSLWDVDNAIAYDEGYNVEFDNYTFDIYADFEISYFNWLEAGGSNVRQLQALRNESRNLINRLQELPAAVRQAQQEAKETAKEAKDLEGRAAHAASALKSLEARFNSLQRSLAGLEVLADSDSSPEDRAAAWADIVRKGDRLEEGIVKLLKALPLDIDARDLKRKTGLQLWEGAAAAWDLLMKQEKEAAGRADMAALQVFLLQQEQEDKAARLQEIGGQLPDLQRKVEAEADAVAAADFSAQLIRLAMMVAYTTLRSNSDFRRKTAATSKDATRIPWAADPEQAAANMKAANNASAANGEGAGQRPDGWQPDACSKTAVKGWQGFFRLLKSSMMADYKKEEAIYNMNLTESLADSAAALSIGWTSGEGLDVLHQAVLAILQETELLRQSGKVQLSNYLQEEGSYYRGRRYVYKDGQAIDVNAPAVLSNIYRRLRQYIESNESLLNSPDAAGAYIPLEGGTEDKEGNPQLPLFADLSGCYIQAAEGWDVTAGEDAAGTVFEDARQVVDIRQTMLRMKLTPFEQRIISMRLQGFSQTAIAALMDIKRDKIGRALKRIQAKAEGCGLFSPADISYCKAVAKKQVYNRPMEGAIIQEDSSGRVVAVFATIQAAAKSTGCNPGHISECLKGSRKTERGYTFRRGTYQD